MKQDYGLIFGLILFLMVIGTFGFLIVDASQTSDSVVADVAQQVRLDEASLVDLRSRSLNGDLPIKLDQAQLGNSDPFRRAAN